MGKIEDLRKQIDEIDDKLMVLLNQRFALSVQIGLEKNSTGTVVLDQNREQFILDKILKHSHSPEIDQVYRSIFTQSRNLQRK